MLLWGAGHLIDDQTLLAEIHLGPIVWGTVLFIGHGSSPQLGEVYHRTLVLSDCFLERIRCPRHVLPSRHSLPLRRWLVTAESQSRAAQNPKAWLLGLGLWTKSFLGS